MDKCAGGTFIRPKGRRTNLFDLYRHGTENTEPWLSGRKYLTANEAGSKSPRGFESLRLRKIRSRTRRRSVTIFLREPEGFEKVA